MESYKIVLVDTRQLVIINYYIIERILYVNFFLQGTGKMGIDGLVIIFNTI